MIDSTQTGDEEVWDKVTHKSLAAEYENKHWQQLSQVYCIVCLFTVALFDTNGYRIENATQYGDWSSD